MTTTQPKRQPIPFGKYLLLDRINIGGMAEVWRGKMFGAGGFERLVAIKRILPNIAEDDEFISMFIDEAKISVQLNHANVAKIEELGQIANNYFIAMEYIPGKDMRAIFDRGRKKSEPAPVPLVAYMVSKMCEGLDYAHRKKDGMGRDLNIVHRDISPQNVLVSFEGEVKIIDFGIAKAAGKATKTQAGILKGKFGYMSPEQIRGLPLDRRSDIFAIGVCLYEMLTGERLFVGDSDFSVLEKVRKAEVAPPSTYNRRIPEALEKIVLKALARDVDERYQYANELGDDLQRFLITSESIFSRKDLMQYMKSTFAEDVEREKQRLQEYADIRPPEGMLAAIEMGFGAHPISPHSTPQLSPPQVEPAPPPPPGVRRSPTMAAMPKLTAAPVAPPKEEEESGATQVVNAGDFDEDNPTGEHVGPGRSVTPMEVPRPPTLQEGPPRAAPRLSHPGMPRPPVLAPSQGESTTVARQGRNTLDSIPRVGRDDASGPARSSTSQGLRPPPPVMSPPPTDDLTEDGIAPASVSAPSGRMPVAAPRSQPVAPAPVAPPPAALAPAGRNRLPLILGGALVALLAIGGGLMALTRPPPTGFIYVILPHDVQGKNPRVSYNGKDLEIPPKGGPILQPVSSGPGVVLVSVEGYKPFTQNVQIPPGTTPTHVEVELQREARLGQLIVFTQPADAELKLNGEVVRPKGDSKTYINNEVPAGTVLTLEASAPGFRSRQEQVSPVAGAPTDVRLTLEADSYLVDVQSIPAGATIVAGGKELGLTPKTVTVPMSVKQVSLQMECYTGVDVPVAPAANGTARVNERLKKVKGRCSK
ncbi:protein kinase domain-containing protein [Archangium primigenium]|uniref:protein kinase domain-containing protein n=1 Tax=[Archangium] primigenium TaxID=2792470 RepID=UPI00195C34F5|nr:protein kinase [Archangium primigenium]